MEEHLTPFEISRQLVEDVFALRPTICTQFGRPGSDDAWDDTSLAGSDSWYSMLRGHRRALEPHLSSGDADARHAATILAAYLDETVSEQDSGDYLIDVSHAYCTFTVVRDIFDIAPRETAADWSDVARRMATFSEPMAGWTEVLAEGVRQGKVAARRQALSLIEQAENLAGEQSMFLGLVAEAGTHGLATPELEDAAAAARSAAGDAAEWLRDNYLPHADEADGVGEERYLRAADRFLGMVIDPAETYEWGWEEVARIRAEMADTAADIDPTASLEEVIALVETDPERSVPVEDFTSFVQERLDQAVAELDGTHFDVPEPVKRVTVSLAPPGGALGAWYHNPSEDWGRPGSVWYALGERQRVPVWQEVSTAYHEGFPGHHLQVGTAMYQADSLSEAHRLFIWYSGYGEGWALYAERLMDELGYFEKPEYRLGMLASQLFRAVRVVVDIGNHLGYPIPAHAPLFGGEEWSFDRAVGYMTRLAIQAPDVAVSEVRRYLGWPGQAISYKVGEREILDIRRQLEARDPAFDRRDFHRQMLEGGELRLDYLRQIMLG